MTPAATQRRGFLRSACQHCLAWGGALSPWHAWAQEPSPTALADAPAALPERFARPSLESEEGGLWGLMDREEIRLKRSPFLVRDTQLDSYLQNLVCRLVGTHCTDIRVHVVRTPLFNASMAPNGMLQVWSGLLLRMENEAQLAAVLGHEIAHYLERHSLERLRDMKSRAAFAQFIGLFGLVGAVGQLGTLASAFAFSREQETRADRLGLQLLQGAGYEGRQAAQVWDNLLDELKVRGGDNVGKRSPMLATHPAAESRRDELRLWAGARPGTLASADFLQATAAHRLDWLHDEIKRGQFEESLALFNRLLALNTQDAQTLYARGEVYRLRANAPDLDFSLRDLSRASRLDHPPAQTFRALGLLQQERADKAAAAQAFAQYLALAPNAPDAGLIKSYLTELTP